VVDIMRAPTPHVAFGKGSLTCIGAQLARIEGRVVFARLFERLPGLQVPEQDVTWQVSSGSRALTALHVTHDRSI
jgi:cytochrome P450